MRRGALPLLFWALLLAAAGALNAIWAGVSIQTATFGAAVAAVLVLAGIIAARPARSGPEAVTRSSFAIVIVAVGLGVLLFGFAFGHFPIYLGAGMMVAGLGRLALELRAQHHAQGGHR